MQYPPSAEEATLFAEKIIEWYQAHKRDLPWRNTQNPYYIWLSEVILQQTRVVQGLPYYERFVAQYPEITALAQAPEDEVMRLWQGLGYYSRARNMHHTARYMVEHLGGHFPDNYQDLLKLKGVGHYTAAAIASFAFGEQVAVLDGNVFRVLARVFGHFADIAGPQGQRDFAALSQALLPEKDSPTYNQAVMEFGALQCSPEKPNCMYCPLQDNCAAYANAWQKELPVKSKKIKQRHRYFIYLMLRYQGRLALRKRSEQDIWGGLYEGLLYEAASFEEAAAQLEGDAFVEKYQEKIILRKETKEYKHNLTHQKLFVQFWEAEYQASESPSPPEDFEWFDEKAYQALPKPILIANYLNNSL